MGEMLLHNAKVYTSDPQRPWCGAIAVKDGVITATGGEELRRNAGPGVELTDAKGRLVLPGFIDSHCHPSLTVYRASLDLFSCGTIGEYQSAIRRYALEHPELPVIKGAGWFYTDFGGAAPHKSRIDEAVSDRTLRYTLDAFERAAKANGKRDSRHIAAHLQLVNEGDIARMRELGVTAAPTAFWFEKGAMYYEVELNNLGKERADREYPMKSLFDAGVLTACGSDSPVSITTPVLDVDFAPLQAIQQGILRANPLSDPDDMKNVSNPAERVSLERMLAAYTINGAKANFAEDRMGSVTPGKEANFIVLDQNIFETAPASIYKTKVLATYFRGRPVWGGI